MKVGDCRCHHVPSRKWQTDGTRFIRLVIGGARFSIQVCPECHSVMAGGGSVGGTKHNSGKKQIREFRRQPEDTEPIWFEVQVI